MAATATAATNITTTDGSSNATTSMDTPVAITFTNTTTPMSSTEQSNVGAIRAGAQIQMATDTRCVIPANGQRGFFFLKRSDGPWTVMRAPLDRPWVMLRSYRDGGIENVHWKFTDDANDGECMHDWSYHAGDGRTLKTFVHGRTTTFGLGRRWCGLPVYHHGGVEGFQWAYVPCTSNDNKPIQTRPRFPQA